VRTELLPPRLELLSAFTSEPRWCRAGSIAPDATTRTGRALVDAEALRRPEDRRPLRGGCCRRRWPCNFRPRISKPNARPLDGRPCACRRVRAGPTPWGFVEAAPPAAVERPGFRPAANASTRSPGHFRTRYAASNLVGRNSGGNAHRPTGLMIPADQAPTTTWLRLSPPAPASLDLRTEANLDRLGVDDQIIPASNPDVWAPATGRRCRKRCGRTRRPWIGWSSNGRRKRRKRRSNYAFFGSRTVHP